MKNRSIPLLNLAMVIAICGVIFMTSCEENRRVIEPFVPAGNRVVLIEEFTGKGCTQCPKGSRELANLLTLFPNNLVAVSIHAGPFANPASYPELGPNDLRSPQAQELFNLLSPILFYPTGAVDRTLVSGDMQLTLNQWASAITKELETEPAVDISIENVYNDVTRELEVTVSGIGKYSVTGDLRLSVMVIENNIIDGQNDIEAGGNGIVLDYVHKHVLRTMLTPAAGESILTSISTGQTFSQTYTTTIPVAWNADNMEIIAFISNVQGASFPVLQATSEPVVE